MKTLKIVSATVVTLLFLAGAFFFLIGYLKAKPGGIFVDSNPASSVYINGNLVGKTPYSGTYETGQINLKLVPEIADRSLVPYETKVTLISKIQTVIRREFGKSEEESSGDVISFEKEGGSAPTLVVVSTPDNAQVSIDGVPRGFAPYKTSSISPAQHQITVKSPGYMDRIMSVKPLAGYRLTVFVKLGKGESSIDGNTPTPSPTPSAESKVYVLISQTPTGFLRVRTEPGTKGKEIAEVKPGEKYQFLEEDPVTGWYKIQYQEPKPGLPNGIQGWVSGQYAKKVDELGKFVSSTPIPSPVQGV